MAQEGALRVGPLACIGFGANERQNRRPASLLLRVRECVGALTHANECAGLRACEACAMGSHGHGRVGWVRERGGVRVWQVRL